MSIRNRISQYLATVLSTRIRCTQGGILLGRKTTGAGYAEEITVGTGLELTAGKVLNVTVTALTRTAAEGPPISRFTLTGITTPLQDMPLVFEPVGALVDGRDTWSNASGEPSGSFVYVGGKWTALLSFGDTYEIESNATTALVPYDPTLTWTVLDGAGDPVFETDYPNIESVGQSLIVGDDSPGNGNRLIYTATSTVKWELTGPSGIIELPDGTFKRATHDGVSVTYEDYTLS